MKLNKTGFFVSHNGTIYENGKAQNWYKRPLTNEQRKLLGEILEQYYKELGKFNQQK